MSWPTNQLFARRLPFALVIDLALQKRRRKARSAS